MSRWLRLTFLLFGSAILAVFLSTTNFHELRGAVVRANRAALILALGLLAGNVVVKAVRWQVMAGRLSTSRLGLPAAGAAILAGVAAGSMTPARGIELAKPLLLRASHGVGLASSTAAVLVERLLDGASLVVLFGISLILLPTARGSQFHPALAAVGVFLLGAALMLAVPDRMTSILKKGLALFPLPIRIHKRLGTAADSFAQGIINWRQSRELWLLLALSVLAAALEAIRLSVVFAALGTNLALLEAMLTFSVANLVAVITLIPGGIGITELSMAGVAGFVTGGRSSRSLLTAAVLTDRVLSYYLVVALGGLVLLLQARLPRGGPGDAN